MYSKTILLHLLALAGCITASAQSYPSASYAAVGDTVYLTRDSILSAGSFDFSQTGANSSWDYNTLSGSSQQRLVFSNPTQTGFSFLQWPYIYNTNNTNLSSSNGQTVAIGSLSYSSFNDYYKKSTNYLEQKASSYTIYYDDVGLPVKNQWTRPDTIYRFPLAFGKKDSCVASYTTSIPGYYFQQRDINRKNEVDGTGQLKTPFGTFNNCIRLVSTVTQTDSIKIGDSSSFKLVVRYRELQWFDASRNYPVLLVRQNLVNNNYMTQYVDYYDNLVYFPPQPLFAYYPLLPNIGDTVLFQNLSTNSSSYAWSFGDTASANNVSTEQNPSHVFNKPGTYPVKLTCFNGGYASDVTLQVVVRSGNFIWNGSEDTDWHNPKNWDRQLVPSYCDAVVTIPATANQPVISQPATVGKLTEEAGATITCKAPLTICGQ